MHAYILTYRPTYIHTYYVRTYIYTYIYPYISTYIDTYSYMHTYIHTSMQSIQPYFHTSIHTYMHTYIHTSTHIHTYLCTHIHAADSVGGDALLVPRWGDVADSVWAAYLVVQRRPWSGADGGPRTLRSACYSAWRAMPRWVCSPAERPWRREHKGANRAANRDPIGSQ